MQRPHDIWLKRTGYHADTTLINVFYRIFTAVADVIFDTGAAAIGGKGGVDQRPFLAVEPDDIVYPSGFFKITADPGMVGVAGIADFEPGRDPLGAQHSRHEGGIIEANPFLGIQGVVYIRDVSVSDIFGFVRIVRDVLDDEMIDCLYCFYAAAAFLYQRSAFGNSFCIGVIIYIYVRSKKGQEFIFEGYVRGLGERNGVQIFCCVRGFEYGEGITAVSAGERVGDGFAARRDQIGTGDSFGVFDLELDFLIGAGVGKDHISPGCVREIHRDDVVGVSYGAGGFGGQDLRSIVSCRSLRCALFLAAGCGRYGLYAVGGRIQKRQGGGYQEERQKFPEDLPSAERTPAGICMLPDRCRCHGKDSFRV